MNRAWLELTRRLYQMRRQSRLMVATVFEGRRRCNPCICTARPTLHHRVPCYPLIETPGRVRSSPATCARTKSYCALVRCTGVLFAGTLRRFSPRPTSTTRCLGGLHRAGFEPASSRSAGCDSDITPTAVGCCATQPVASTIPPPVHLTFLHVLGWAF